jgi:hypothetical protein
MHVNVYNEELTDRVKFVTKTVESTGVTFYGISFHLASPPDLHHSPGDDDTPAVTFWGNNPEKLHRLLSRALKEIDNSK